MVSKLRFDCLRGKCPQAMFLVIALLLGLRVQASGTVPAAIPIEPSQSWDGNDGPWSTFLVGVGSPSQFSKVLVSTSANQPWFVIPKGCTQDDPPDCAAARGGFFTYNKSTSWHSEGIYNLHFEQNLNYTGNGYYGTDTLALGLQGSGAPQLEKQLVAGIATKDIYIATLGVRPAPSNFSDFNDPIPSFMEELKDKSVIASLSWGYTAGCFSEFMINKQGLGSLTLGGYDETRFRPNGAAFSFAGDSERLLSVGLRSVTVDSFQLLPTPLVALIDSGVPHIWLPLDACRVFERQFQLTWNATLSLYLTNATATRAFVSQNANVSFMIAEDASAGSPGIQIDIPYRALTLNLTDKYPGASENTQYFALRRASNSTQYTLGRAFLQYAYIIADYERSTFNISQALFPSSSAKQLRTIDPPNATASSPQPKSGSASGSTLTTGGLAGAIVGAVVVAVALVLAMFFCLRRRRARRDNKPKKVEAEMQEMGDSKGPLAEIGDGKKAIAEIEGDQKHTSELELGSPLSTELHGEDRVLELVGGWEGHELDQKRVDLHELE